MSRPARWRRDRRSRRGRPSGRAPCRRRRYRLRSRHDHAHARGPDPRCRGGRDRPVGRPAGRVPKSRQAGGAGRSAVRADFHRLPLGRTDSCDLVVAAFCLYHSPPRQRHRRDRPLPAPRRDGDHRGRSQRTATGNSTSLCRLWPRPQAALSRPSLYHGRPQRQHPDTRRDEPERPARHAPYPPRSPSRPRQRRRVPGDLPQVRVPLRLAGDPCGAGCRPTAATARRGRSRRRPRSATSSPERPAGHRRHEQPYLKHYPSAARQRAEPNYRWLAEPAWPRCACPG